MRNHSRDRVETLKEESESFSSSDEETLFSYKKVNVLTLVTLISTVGIKSHR